MANKLQQEWKGIKTPLEKMVSDFKKSKSGWNTAPLEAILKKMNMNFGDTLGKAGDAFKAKKDADVKKYAGRALQIAEAYKKLLASLPKNRGDGGIDYAAKLDPIINKLHPPSQHGITNVANPF
jgi:hypothetical protein